MLNINGKLIANPFDDPDPKKREELWERLRNGRRITKEEFYAHIEELRRKKAERDAQKNNDSAKPAA